MTTDYAALADTIKIEDITSNKNNQIILQQLKNNDESFESLHIMDETGDDDDYILKDGEDIGWLGYYIGQSTKLKCLYFYETINLSDESFYKEMSCNKSVKEIHFENSSLDGDKIRMLGPFFKNNTDLNKISVDECEFGVNGALYYH